jgi:hypothetical protein
MSNSLQRISSLTLAFAALLLLCADISGAQSASKPELSGTAQLARHYQHEDAIYGTRSVGAAPRTPTDAIALHFNHEDAIYRARQERPSGRSASQLIALHFQHEDALDKAQRSASSRLPRAAAVSTHGSDWNDALVGAGGAVAVLLLSGAAIVAIRRIRSSSDRPLVRS